MIKLARLMTARGRAGRREFCAIVACALCAMVGIVAAQLALYLRGFDHLVIPILAVAGIMLACAVLLAGTARRLHDLGHSGLWIFAFALPAKVVMVLPRAFPEALSESSGIVALGTALAACLLWLGVVKGTPGDNEYGPPPRARCSPATG